MKHALAKINLTSMFLLLIAPVASAQTTRHVDSDAPGDQDGTSWEHAFIDLQDALHSAHDGDRILIAEGTYRPAQTGGDRAVSFELVSGVRIYGGYAGYGEPEPDLRDFDRYGTVLSGDLDGDDGAEFENTEENSFHVILATRVGETTVVDGVTVIGGNANGSEFSNQHVGGGYLGMQCATVFRNCRLTKNQARFGGGVFEFLSEGVYANCMLAENAAHSSGGGMFRFGGVVKLHDCEFLRNTAIEGGGMTLESDTESTIENCLFELNQTRSTGGAVQDDGASTTLIRCTFRENLADGDGGAYHERSGYVLMFGCHFEGNTARGSESGGGVWSLVGDLELVGCSFFDNTAGGGQDGGGAIGTRGQFTSIAVTECVFVRNHSGLGGAIHAAGRVEVSDSFFEGNVAATSGGAMYATRGGFVTDSLFLDNMAREGGAIYAWSALGLVGGVTFFNNGATRQRGGGVYIRIGTEMDVADSILWNNEPDQVFVQSGENDLSFHHSIIQGGYPGEGNIDVDPEFVDPDARDFRLSPSSPAIDAGDPNFEADPEDADLDGHPRVLCARVDIGAYEFGIGDFDCDRDVSLGDFASWSGCVTGPNGGPYPAGCEAFDFDADQDVDLRDFAGFGTRFPN